MTVLRGCSAARMAAQPKKKVPKNVSHFKKSKRIKTTQGKAPDLAWGIFLERKTNSISFHCCSIVKKDSVKPVRAQIQECFGGHLVKPASFWSWVPGKCGI